MTMHIILLYGNHLIIGLENQELEGYNLNKPFSYITLDEGFDVENELHHGHTNFFVIQADNQTLPCPMISPNQHNFLSILALSREKNRSHKPT